MQYDVSYYHMKLAQTVQEIQAAQNLRYRVFVNEMGALAHTADHKQKLEHDAFDPICDHLILLDRRETDIKKQVVGVYRMMRDDMIRPDLGYYSANEYDLKPLLLQSRKLLELGRLCIDPKHRNGMVLGLLWDGVARYINDYQREILFGTVSFSGTNVASIAPALSYLYHYHLAEADKRVKARGDIWVDMNIIPIDTLNKKEAIAMLPPLMKSYLRLGAYVGEGAFIDQDFNMIDVFFTLDTVKMTRNYQSRFYKDN